MLKHRGFTIVELLIVIVVIAILAAISVVAYNGIQERARTSSRMSSIRSIQKGLESYRAIHGFYPPTSAIGSAQPSGFSPAYGSGYEYSVATNDTWMKSLRDSGIVTQKVTDPINDNSHYFIYLRYGGENGGGSCTEPVYVLIAYGWEGGTATQPGDSRPLNCSISGVVTASWFPNANMAVFSNLDHPTGS